MIVPVVYSMFEISRSSIAYDSLIAYHTSSKQIIVFSPELLD